MLHYKLNGKVETYYVTILGTVFKLHIQLTILVINN